jgi:hypothetical protein
MLLFREDLFSNDYPINENTGRSKETRRAGLARSQLGKDSVSFVVGDCGGEKESKLSKGNAKRSKRPSN